MGVGAIERVRNPDYARSVFLNCPFDSTYLPLFEAAVFVVMDCGFHIRCAKEMADASHVRIHKIYELIRSARLGIHDISRTELEPSTNLPRFNMPLELGIFLGAKYLGDKTQRSKECLILDKERFRYQKYVSDVAGQDIAAHKDDPRTLISEVRDWLTTMTEDTLPGASIIWDRYQRFRSELPEECRKRKQSVDNLTYLEYVRYVDQFRPSKDHALIVSGKKRIVNPSPSEIRRALKALPGGEDSFAIYEKGGSGLSYMQTHGAAKEGFVLEYQAGSLDAHFRCTNRGLSVERVVEAFISYAAADDRWQTEFRWKAHLF